MTYSEKKYGLDILPGLIFLRLTRVHRLILYQICKQNTICNDEHLYGI